MKRMLCIGLTLLGLLLAFASVSRCAEENIYTAAQNGELAKVQQLIGGDPSLLNAVDMDGRTPLLYACCWGRLELANWLLEKGAKINLRDKDNRIALHWAAGMGFKEVVAALIAHNSDLWVKDKDQRTPRELAVYKKRDEVVALLQDAETKHPAESDTPIDTPGQIYPTRINPADGAEMVLVPAGEFIMGEGNGAGSEKPVRQVYLDAFWAYKKDVTVAQYRNYCLANKRRMPYPPSWGWQDDHPMVMVSWEDALNYAIWASGGVGLLPTEAQWEKAARGTDGRTYPWGNTWDAAKCNSLASALEKTSPVGSFPQGASPYGLLDMAGNVDQWCFDWFDTNYYATGPTHNPTGPKVAPDPANNSNLKPSRVRRGGSFASDMKWMYSAHRNGLLPNGTLGKVGFRVVIPLAAEG